MAAGLILGPAAVFAQVAILESVAGSVRDGLWRLRFRTGPASKVKAVTATLLLHLAGGETPGFLEVLKPVKGRAAAAAQREGWITARLDPRCAQRIIDRDEWLEFRAPGSPLFHLQSHTGFVPYIVVEGSR